MQTEKTGGRYALLDELRGFDLLNMFVYHALWDLVFLYGLKAEWYTGWLGRLWQQSGCWIFILLSGFLAVVRCSGALLCFAQAQRSRRSHYWLCRSSRFGLAC